MSLKTKIFGGDKIEAFPIVMILLMISIVVFFVYGIYWDGLESTKWNEKFGHLSPCEQLKIYNADAHSKYYTHYYEEFVCPELSCKEDCIGFNFSYYKFETERGGFNMNVVGNDCWCLDEDELPKQIW